MDALRASLALAKAHAFLAAVQCIVFFIGAASSALVLKYRLVFLMRFPLWMMHRVLRFLGRRPHYLRIFAVIFLFNSTAILGYMLTGALAPALPAAISFLTGMNIGIVAGVLPSSVTRASGPAPVNPPAAPDAPEPPSRHAAAPRLRAGEGGLLEAISLLLVAGLELPAFWLSMAMGTTIVPFWWQGTAPALSGPLAPRMEAYLILCVPTLAVSALIEAAGIRSALKKRRPLPGEGEEPPCR